MPRNPASVIAETLAALLHESGFIRTGLRWYRYEEDSILLIDIQPARSYPGPYINLGVYYYRYGDVDKPRIEECHASMRLTSVVPSGRRERELLDLSNDISIGVRGQELAEMIRAYAIPWLEGAAKFDTAKSFLAKNKSRPAYIMPIARADLGTPEDPEQQ